MAGVKGTGLIDVACDVLELFLSHLPRAYAVVGSAEGEPGMVRFRLESEELAPGMLHWLRIEVRDVGSSRVVQIEPFRKRDPSDPWGVSKA